MLFLFLTKHKTYIDNVFILHRKRYHRLILVYNFDVEKKFQDLDLE